MEPAKDRPLSTIVRVASTPDQAKLFVALLQAEGIPACIEGDSLVDEFAMSRRLMNLNCVRVMVPTVSLAQASDILGPVEIDSAELERQALAAPPPEPPLADLHLVPGRTASRFMASYWLALFGLPLIALLAYALMS